MEKKSISRNKNLLNTPSDYDRYIILENELKKENRIEDLENLINLLSPPKDIRNICTSHKGKGVNIAIVGAGEAGLAAAYELKKIGCNITIFEASKRIGGRVYTYSFDRLNKYYGDFGEISIPISHYTTWHYINLFNLETYPCINKDQYYYLRNSFAYNTEKQIKKNIFPKYTLTKTDKMKLKNREHLSLYNKYLMKLSAEERKELIEIKKNYSNKIVDLDKLTLKRAFELEGFSEDAINMIGYINGIKEWYNFSLTEFLQKQYTLDFKNNYSIIGGMIKLPQALYSAIIDSDLKSYSNISKEELGIVNVKLGSSVEEIFNNKDRIALRYKDLENKLEVTEDFDFLLITAPFNSIKRIKGISVFSNDKLAAIDEIKLKNSQKIYLYVKERFWEKGGNNKRIIGGKTITDLPIYSIEYPLNNESIYFDENNNACVDIRRSSKKPGILLASSSIGDKADEFSYLTDDIKINDTISYIENIHNLSKGYLDNILLDYKSLVWSDVQYIWGFSTIYKPEDKTLYSYSSINPEFNRRVFFAGDSSSNKHGTQQGELQSGAIAANNIAEEILKMNN
ncbi:NAD(P)/FAD-dependent oxidoreductase [Clostridium sp.]|uniref:flavin monoamine oxidase family protein n=1 Tax=Clostridium sp. TaxID=1506 RepID=UPI002910CFC9|nr:NAD(P)/FAD-dependent oxidoreductase [Clostridium sp.]MDU5107509.1 NAD(P)/FAD-dependent oxidoreductase [Clostridium sp.]